MAHISRAIRIDCPPETVFDVLARVDRLPEFSPMTVDVTDDPGRPVVTGDTFKQVIKVAGVELSTDWEVVEVDRPNLLRFRGTSSGNGTAELTERIEATDTGSHVALVVDYELPLGVLGEIADRLVVERRNEEEADAILDGLRRVCSA